MATPPTASLDISVVIPAYNEAGAIGDTVRSVRALGLESSEVIVVDDGSTDGTGRAAEAAGARVVSHPYNIGNGASVKSGIRAAHGKVIVFMDGDGQHEPSTIPKMVGYLSRYHMVVGARTKASQTHWHRTFANWFYNSFASLIAEFKIEDLTSGFRAMRRDDALRFCDMFPNRFSYPTTSTLAFIRTGRSIKYLPIKTRYRVGKSKIKLIHDGFEFLIIIMKIAMSFSPLRVFLPVSSFLFFCGVGRYIYTYFAFHSFTNMSGLLINSSVIVFMLGLIAEQIASLRLEKGDTLHRVEDESYYADLSRYAAGVEAPPGPSEETAH